MFRNNVISGNRAGGVAFGGNYNKLAGNKIGVAPDGVTPLPNGGPGVSPASARPTTRSRRVTAT